MDISSLSNDELNSFVKNTKSNAKLNSTFRMSNDFINSTISSWIIDNITNDKWIVDNITDNQIYQFLKNDKINRICDNRCRIYTNDGSMSDVFEFVNKKRKNGNLFSLLKDDKNINKLLAYFFYIYKSTKNSIASKYNIGSTGDYDGGAKKTNRKIHIGKKGGKYYVKNGNKIYIK